MRFFVNSFPHYISMIANNVKIKWKFCKRHLCTGSLNIPKVDTCLLSVSREIKKFKCKHNGHKLLIAICTTIEHLKKE